MNNIGKKINEGAKFIYIFKNGPETFDGHTDPECLKSIMTEGIPGISTINVLHHGSDSAANGETSLALAVWIIQNGGQIKNYLSGDKRLRDSKIFALFEEEIFRNKTKKENLSGYNFLNKFYDKELRQWSRELRNFIYETFDNLNDGDVCAVPCHSPTAETIFNCFSKNPKEEDIKELEGFILICTKEGLIKTAP